MGSLPFTSSPLPFQRPLGAGSTPVARCGIVVSTRALNGQTVETQGGTLNYFWAVWYGAPCQSQTGVIIANVRQEAPCRFSGYSTAAPVVGDPHTPGL